MPYPRKTKLSNGLVNITLLFAVLVTVPGNGVPLPDSIVVTVAHQAPSAEGPWWIAPLLTFLGIVIGARMIVLQMRSQHKTGMELQRENERMKLKLAIYDSIRLQIDEVHETASKVDSYISFIPATFRVYTNFKRDGIEPAPIRYRAMEFLDLNAAFHQALSNLIGTIEDFQIIEPKIMVFQRALLAVSYDLQRKYAPLYKQLSMFLPMDLPSPAGEAGATIAVFPSFPTDEKLSELDELIRQYQSAAFEATCYLFDFRVQAQNLLLGILFGTQISPRKPSDPDAIVVTLDEDKVGALMKHFEEKIP